MKASELHSLSDLLEQQVATFATALATIENKYKQATADLSRKEDDTAYVNDKCVRRAYALPCPRTPAACTAKRGPSQSSSCAPTATLQARQG